MRGRNSKHRSILNLHGKEAIGIAVKICKSLEEALQKEIFHINCLRGSGIDLTNAKPGGDTGALHSGKSRNKQSLAMKNRMNSADYRQKMNDALLGNKNGLGNRSNSGLKHSEETRKKMSSSAPKMKGHFHKAKIAVSHATRGAMKNSIPFSWVPGREIY